MSDQPFKFKQFSIAQEKCAMKVGTDGVLLGAWVDVSGASIALDIGAGTGVIAIMLAQRNPDMIIEAVEINDLAYEQAKENMSNVPWSGNLSVFHDSVQDFAQKTSNSYELIVSNPPFFSGGTLSSHHSRNDVRHTVKLPSGDLLRVVRKLLAPHGRFGLILPHLEGLKFKELAESYSLFCTRMTEVRPKVEKGVERLLMEFEKVEKPMKKDELVIQYEGRNNYTEEYIALTKAFYLFM